MASRNRRRSSILRDAGRLVAPLDVLYHIGNQIYRRSLRYTAFTVAISIVGSVAKQFSLPGLTAKQAILLPLAVGSITLVGGLLLRVVPSLISSRLINVAQANDLNLMEDYRKSEVDDHLAVLWERLYRHECRMHLAAGRPALEGMDACAPEAVEAALAHAATEFLARAGVALQTFDPQIRQLHLVGIDLRHLEDWRDGAYLDRSDTKLTEQFEGNAALLAARRAAGLTGVKATRRFALRRTQQRLWFGFIIRVLGMQVGTAVQALNRRYDTDLFNSQVLLWPGEEDEPWLADLDGARQDVLRRRKQIVRRVFGPDLHTAREVLDHMLYGSFACATELRMRFDAGYCEGAPGYDVLGDLRAEGRDPADLRRAERFVAQARVDLAAFDELLADLRPGLTDPANAEARRAVRNAFHVDRGQMRRKLMKALARNGRLPALPPDVAAVIDEAARASDAHSRRLLAVRQHHELTRLARAGYRKLLEALAYSQ